jgi:hypothetical protein
VRLVLKQDVLRTWLKNENTPTLSLDLKKYVVLKRMEEGAYHEHQKYDNVL